ncbi:MAG: hypothetical protein A2808_02260 [Candidatus Moranbacteria bacterium RIFCSPHIGHO2_01_FULL_55_24]|nr:MAG: hypothetical protein A2808_02260 [Candidatus Moranbacteria bacterium RIFCSPHIGHO2_01_FULL_55_24]
MRSYIAILSVGALLSFSAPLAAFAQEQVSPSVTPGLGTQSAAPVGNVFCFDYYRFGSVQADLESNLASTVPGAEIGFAGNLKNDNDYPLVDGTLYVKIFKKDDRTFQAGNGNVVVDQFPLEEAFTLPAKGEKPVSFTWNVPRNLPGGDYYAAFFFATSDRYNILGLSFTDDVIGNQAPFSVVNAEESPVVSFDKNAATLNDTPHTFVAFPPHFKSDETVTAKVKLVNASPDPVIVPVIWKQYSWDALRPENIRNQKTELVEVKGNETKEISYAAISTNDAVTYLVVETKDQEAKTFLDIRFVRDGIQETRINFPSVLKFPLKAGEENALFVCAHSTNEPTVKENLLMLTLRDENQNVIRQFRYDGDISGAMSGWKDSFTPDKTYTKVSLTATLERQGRVFEEVLITYDCDQIDPDLCTESGMMLIGEGDVKSLVVYGIALLTLVALLVIFIAKLKRRKARLGA